jgi:hypothetical protein
MPAEDCQHTLDKLDADRGTLAKLPELHRLRASLNAAGLGELAAGMAGRQASEEFAVRAFWYAWLRSILDHLSQTDLSVGSFSAEAQQKVSSCCASTCSTSSRTAPGGPPTSRRLL